MRPEDFDYELPEELIAQQPAGRRTACRLLRVSGAACQDLEFADLPGLLNPGDLLVLNDTRVLPARLYGRKTTGGKLELLLERIVEPGRALVQLKASRSPGIGAELEFDGAFRARVEARKGPFYTITYSDNLEAILDSCGHMPLPPYIRRPDRPPDFEQYQTVYARENGAVAAPTAGLHFDRALLDSLGAAGVGIVSLTLHVGAGTFRPLQPEQIRSGRLHAERLRVDATVCAAVAETRARGGRVVAVGTTVVRALETAAAGGELRPFCGETELFIMPGYRFAVADTMITNFHLPRSSLMMLVCAFGGTQNMLAAYRHAVSRGYRFFSYGDAMLIEGRPPGVPA